MLSITWANHWLKHHGPINGIVLEMFLASIEDKPITNFISFGSVVIVFLVPEKKELMTNKMLDFT